MRPLAIILALATAASAVSAQAAPNTSLALIGYNSLKARLKPQGELGAQIAQLDTALRAAQRAGQTAEVRRIIAKGTALMNGRVWADTNDYRQSLVLRTEHLIVDPSQPYSVRLEQTYAPSIVLSPNLTATATIRLAFSPVAVTPAAAARTLVQSNDVSRDLRDNPLRLDLDLKNTPDGDYTIEVTVADTARTLGSARMRITVLAGVSARLAALEAQAAKAPEAVRADLRYPGDYVRKIDRGAVAIGGFSVASELTAAEALAAKCRVPSPDCRVPKTGDLERHYWLDAANEIMPYRVYVPSAYDGKKAMPLIIALHGAGGSEDSFFDSYNKLVPQLAEQHGYIVAAPMGYRGEAGYGSPIMNAGSAAAISEQDVMQVLARMRQDYKIDPSRIYLMGHSMGAIGTWYLGPKYVDIWAALGAFSGIGVPASAERMKTIPQFVVHGDNDNTVNVQYSRAMVAEFQRLGMDFKYTEVPGGDHNGVVVPNLAAMFDFFDLKKKP